MKLLSDIPCECGFTTEAKFKRPPFLGESIATVTCQGCDSRIVFWAKRAKGNKVSIRKSYVTFSETLDSILLDRVQDNVKEMMAERGDNMTNKDTGAAT